MAITTERAHDDFCVVQLTRTCQHKSLKRRHVARAMCANRLRRIYTVLL